MDVKTLEGKEYETVDINFSKDKRIVDTFLVNLNNANIFYVANDGFEIDGKICYWLKEENRPVVIRDYNEVLENFSAIREVKEEA